MRWFKLLKQRIIYGFTQQDFFNPIFICDFLINYITQITTDKEKLKYIDNPNFIADSYKIIKGLQLRKELITRQKVFQGNVISKSYGIPEFTTQQKKLHDQCIFLLDKYFYLLTFKN